jgi:hypothetical protein
MKHSSRKFGIRLFSPLGRHAMFVALATVLSPLWAQPTDDALRRGFETPPNSAKPRVWWHWMDGNITKEGITLDLEWMKRVGIGGMQNFDAAANTPKVVDQRLVYMTPDWQDAFRHAVNLAEKLDLEMGIASSAGWSETGGPWVTPKQAMKKLVWSRNELTGGQPFEGQLPQPPSKTGGFQDAPMLPLFGMEQHPREEFYADSVVLAYRTPVEDVLPEKAVSNAGPLTLAALTDGSMATGQELIAQTGTNAWIQYEYARPQTVQAVSLALPVRGGMAGNPTISGRLEASDDGKTFRHVKELEAGSFFEKTVSFAPVSAKFFRLTLAPGPEGMNFAKMLALNAAAGVAADPNLAPPPGASAGGETKYTVNEFMLYSSARINEFELKAAFAGAPDYYALDSGPNVTGTAVPKAEVIDLTAKMDAQGKLRWTPPPGRWTVIRLGYSLLGKTNHPASAEGTGLEVDKLSRTHVKSYLDHYLKRYEDAVGTDHIGSNGVKVLLADSIESGFQNWTDDLVAEFKRLRGYDPTPWLPALTGVMIESAQASDKFLWDFRRTIAQLIADNHYGQIAASAHQLGLTVYGEALESFRPTIGDDMEMRRFADVPMGAMWYFKPQVGPGSTALADDRGAASVAHLYGQNIVAAESMTSALAPWAHSPRELKHVIDLEFALGINRPVIHTSVHQPLIDRKPGIPLIIFGQYFTRTETWAEQAGPWVSYLSRNAHLLQQGRFFADVAYFYGEEAPLVSLFGNQPLQDVPEGYGYDFVNSHALLNLFAVDKGELTVPSGMRYKVLHLGGASRRMTLPVLRKLRELVSAGATVIGSRPEGSPSLADDEAEFQKIADQLWPNSGAGAHTANLGAGRVVTGLSLTEALVSLQLPADFAYTKPKADTSLLFLHRKLADGDIYYVDNRNDRHESVELSFRVAGKAAELWHADTGLIEKASYRITGDHTTVPLTLSPFEAVYVVFRQPAATTHYVAPKFAETLLATIAGSWAVGFDPALGGPVTATFDQLASWSESGDSAIKYYSGTGRYTKTIEAPATWFKTGARILLDLGDVRELAEVSLNGQPLGISWHPPYRIDVTGLLKPGANALEIKVTNLWVNRLIGDLQPGVTKKYTFTANPTYNPDAPLRASGLIGPVTLWSMDADTH